MGTEFETPERLALRGGLTVFKDDGNGQWGREDAWLEGRGTAWFDGDQNGWMGEGEVGWVNVPVTLFAPMTDPENGTQWDEWLQQTRTDENGDYRFNDLPPGVFLVLIEPWAFNEGEPLYGMVLAVGAQWDDDVDGDDNWIDSEIPAYVRVAVKQGSDESPF